MLRKKSLVESTRHAVGTGQGAMLQTSASPGFNCFLSLPSNDTHAWLLLLKGTCTRTVTCSGNMRGRKDKECGQIGVNRMPGTCKDGNQITFHITTDHCNSLLSFFFKISHFVIVCCYVNPSYPNIHLKDVSNTSWFLDFNWIDPF